MAPLLMFWNHCMWQAQGMGLPPRLKEGVATESVERRREFSVRLEILFTGRYAFTSLARWRKAYWATCEILLSLRINVSKAAGKLFCSSLTSSLN